MPVLSSQPAGKRKRLLAGVAVSAGILLIGIGVFAKNGWFPDTVARTGWFGKKLPKNASSSWNPLAAPNPTPTPQLKVEYLHAGSRLLAIEDANANAAPPADLAVWRPSSGVWWIYNSSGNHTVAQFGLSGDIPAQGDYDGDGKTDFCVFRPSNATWWILRSFDNTFVSVSFGLSTDQPVGGSDFDGDGRSDIAVFRKDDPSAGFGKWYILRSSDLGVTHQQFGLNSDVPAPHDFDGDGRADINVWRSSDTTFYTLNSSNGTLSTRTFGTSGDTPIPADYDGDGRANYALKSGSNWKILTAFPNIVTGTGSPQGSESVQTVSFQQSSDIPVQNDYDGDGIVDIATWRDSNGTWYIRQSSKLGVSGQTPTSGNPYPNELRQVQFGMTGDLPVGAYYRR